MDDQIRLSHSTDSEGSSDYEMVQNLDPEMVAIYTSEGETRFAEIPFKFEDYIASSMTECSDMLALPPCSNHLTTGDTTEHRQALLEMIKQKILLTKEQKRREEERHQFKMDLFDAKINFYVKALGKLRPSETNSYSSDNHGIDEVGIKIEMNGSQF